MKKKTALLILSIGTIGVLATIISVALDNPDTPLGSALGTFKYFTILSNLIVIVYFWLVFSLNMDRFPIFKTLFGAVVVYITVTFLVYAVMLEGTFDLSGLGRFGSILCHYVVPIMTIGFLIYYRDEYSFHNKDILKWIAFPIVYFVFLVLFGVFTGDYIYPFFDINEVGFLAFLIAFLGIMGLFILLSFLVILITRPIKKN
ncbi:MAG: Pr6Pr family membrane protein [Bacilli bacterium]|nr:Pr6Pr family membrane protein [Bacilli bacterium]MBN2877887.1 Pr6Pr family membrane protein [Bacilli bacterium]